MEEKRFPRYIAEPLKLIVFLEWDDVGIAMAFYLMTLMVSKQLLIGVFVAPFLYRRSKKTQARGFLQHLLYRFGLLHFRGYPSAFERRFKE